MSKTVKNVRPRSALLNAKAERIFRRIKGIYGLPINDCTYDSYRKSGVSRQELNQCIDMLEERGLVEVVQGRDYVMVVAKPQPATTDDSQPGGEE